MTTRQIGKLSKEIVENLPPACGIFEVLNYLNDKGMLHSSHDDLFLWDKEILEAEHPKICAEIRREEREKVIQEIKDKINEVSHVL